MKRTLRVVIGGLFLLVVLWAGLANASQVVYFTFGFGAPWELSVAQLLIVACLLSALVGWLFAYLEVVSLQVANRRLRRELTARDKREQERLRMARAVEPGGGERTLHDDADDDGDLAPPTGRF